jgi:iron complex outermembrane receptor protein
MYPEGFLPLENSRRPTTSLVTGLRGEASGWRWDVSANYGSNEFKLDLDNTVNLDLAGSQPDPLLRRQAEEHAALLNVDVAKEFPVEAFSGR